MPKINLNQDKPSADTASQEIPVQSDPEVANNGHKAAKKSVTDPAIDAYVAKINELTNDLQRTRADFENFRKQVDVQKTQAMDVAKYTTATKFLPLIDDLDRAMSVYADQLAPLKKNLDKTLQSLGLARIDSEAGTEFNPDFHEAVSVEDGDGDQEVVAETLRPGYLYNGAVIRVAMVKVKRA